MKRGRRSTAMLCVLTVLLMLSAGAVIYMDLLLGSLYAAQQERVGQSAGATPMPVLKATPTPVPSATPAPTRTPLMGDVAVDFPAYDTGVGADYSHQSDELRIAVRKVQDEAVTYFVADIWMRNISCFRTAFSSGKYRGRREDAEKIAQDNQAILAVNGDFLGGLVLRNGELYRMANLRPTEPPDPFTGLSAPSLRPERSTCVLYGDGHMVTEEYDTFRSRKAMAAGAWQGWQFGPTLVRNGEAMPDVKKQGRNPRTMLGYYAPGHYCIVVIDGRKKGYSIGMNFEEMTELALSLGLQEAYNLDGGGSAIMTFNGKIINDPSGANDGRSLPDMVVIGEYLAPAQLRTPIPAPTPAVTPSATP